MSASRKLLAYAAGLAAVFGASLVVGGAISPTGLAAAEPTEAHGAMAPGMAMPGLATAEDGLQLVPEVDTQAQAVERPYRFRILDEGRTVTDFDLQHTKRMHLIVVRRDFVGFQHLHPTMAADGTWRIPLTLDDAGTYRVYADFAVGGDKHTLGTDLFVPGAMQPQPVPPTAHTADAGNGYTVALHGTPVAGQESELDFVVHHDGEVISHLQPYLGAQGHLVALRDGDLAYLHVHADEEHLTFEAQFPTPGTYRLFLQFKHAGTVRTAAFTVHVEENR